jgi:hypothetical protein
MLAVAVVLEVLLLEVLAVLVALAVVEKALITQQAVRMALLVLPI